jgi:magnesium transporter
VGKNFLVSYHKEPYSLLNRIMEELRENPKKAGKGVDYLFYHIISQIIDQYFPLFLDMGDQLERLEEIRASYNNQNIPEQIFIIRKALLTLRRSLVPFQEVVTQIMHPEDPEWETDYAVFFSDVHDHINRLVEMTEFYREMAGDLIESVGSLNAQRVNHVILVLTVITTIFMPLTFIVGIYGMNFDFMPELRWKFGYPLVLSLMGGISGVMVIWFKKKGWL